MKILNKYINEAWGGVKRQVNKADIEAWCDDMGIKNYTINSKGEIDVDGYVNLRANNIIELPYKFGKVTGFFEMEMCKNLISLKNCPGRVGRYFSCSRCSQLDSLEGCPKEVGIDFWCDDCKRKFTKEEVESLCKVKRNIVV